MFSIRIRIDFKDVICLPEYFVHIEQSFLRKLIAIFSTKKHHSPSTICIYQQKSVHFLSKKNWFFDSFTQTYQNCTWRPFKGHCHGRLLCISTDVVGFGDINVLGSVSYSARSWFYVKKAAVNKSKEQRFCWFSKNEHVSWTVCMAFPLS